jgi:hypothetical protein
MAGLILAAVAWRNGQRIACQKEAAARRELPERSRSIASLA